MYTAELNEIPRILPVQIVAQLIALGRFSEMWNSRKYDYWH
jgi:hypothetical protein